MLTKFINKRSEIEGIFHHKTFHRLRTREDSTGTDIENFIHRQVLAENKCDNYNNVHMYAY